jgi:prepilin-type N-terminal cleavage/methylation domain-containing protein
MNAPTCRGFTLVEVLIALVIGGMVVLMSHQLFASVIDGTRVLDSTRARLEEEELSGRWLRAAFHALEAGDKAGGFEGRPDNVRFTTWVLQPGGWMERRTIRLALRDSALVATSDEATAILRRNTGGMELDYLLEPGADSRWVREWVSPVSVPLAVRIRLQVNGKMDTLLCLVGGRG